MNNTKNRRRLSRTALVLMSFQYLLYYDMIARRKSAAHYCVIILAADGSAIMRTSHRRSQSNVLSASIFRLSLRLYLFMCGINQHQLTSGVFRGGGGGGVVRGPPFGRTAVF